MFCPNCGNQIPDESKFCPSCGTAIGAPAQGEPARPSSGMPPVPGVEPGPSPAHPVPVGAAEAMDVLLKRMRLTGSNAEFLMSIKEG